jgi:hypothetical protein
MTLFYSQVTCNWEILFIGEFQMGQLCVISNCVKFFLGPLYFVKCIMLSCDQTRIMDWLTYASTIALLVIFVKHLYIMLLIVVHMYNRDSCRGCGSSLSPFSSCIICREHVSWNCHECDTVDYVVHTIEYCEGNKR